MRTGGGASKYQNVVVFHLFSSVPAAWVGICRVDLASPCSLRWSGGAAAVSLLCRSVAGAYTAQDTSMLDMPIVAFSSEGQGAWHMKGLE
jgi:hypothetical protein